MVRETQLPTSLRTSALSLLADCENTSAIALEPYNYDLSETMIDLLQVEAAPRRESDHRDTESKKKTDTTQSMDEQPTSRNTKLPPLRRAALHFLSLLVKSSIERIYYKTAGLSGLSDSTLSRAQVVLSYIASTDSDDIVRVMAREVLELVHDLDRAKLNI
jgi:alpha-D-ribose 1-methylphosphonate 5-triphosphate synthase subunit PhnI